jgi:hypothetical protein
MLRRFIYTGDISANGGPKILHGNDTDVSLLTIVQVHKDTDMRPDIGSYYGNLVTLEEFIDNEEFSFETNYLQGRRDAIEYLEKFKNLGVAEIRRE